MIEQITEYGNLKKIEHRFICPECNVELKTEGTVFLTDPPQFKYYCPQCKYETISFKTPYTELVGDVIHTYQQEIN